MSKLKSYNNQIGQQLMNKYGREIEQVQINAFSNEEYSRIVKNATNDYVKAAKGTNDLKNLNPVLENLYARIFKKIEENSDDLQMEDADLLSNKKRLEQRKNDLDERIKEMQGRKDQNQRDYNKLSKENEYKAEEIKRLKRDNIDLEKDIETKNRTIEEQKNSILGETKLKEKLSKKKRFLCC